MTMKARHGTLALIVLAVLLTLTQPGQAAALPASRQNPPQGDSTVSPQELTPRAWLPIVRKDPFSCYTGSNYTYGIAYRGEDPPIIDAKHHPDKNLAVRGYTNTGQTVAGPTGQSGDYGTEGPRAPKLNGLFAPARQPSPFYLYQVYDWIWNHSILPDHGTRGNPLAAGTMISLPTSIGEVIRVPNSAYSIGAGMEVIVLYADATRITLRIGRDDTGGTVPNKAGFAHPGVGGYVIHVEGFCVDPNLVALYQSLDNYTPGCTSSCPRYSASTFNLVTLAAGQPMGVANDIRIGVSVRDSGQFTLTQMKDWWLP